MSKYVCDASAVLAFLRRESGWEKLFEYISDSCISAVNYAEVRSKLLSYGFPKSDFYEELNVKDFDVEQAKIVGDLYPKTKAFGLSLGDRACLALGLKTKLPIVTTDKIWSKLELDHEIICAR